jgi:hypothetical protein
MPEEFPDPPPCLHQTVDRESAQQAVESGHTPWPKTWGMHDDAERDVAADSQAECKNDPFSHHRRDWACVIESDR